MAERVTYEDARKGWVKPMGATPAGVFLKGGVYKAIQPGSLEMAVLEENLAFRALLSDGGWLSGPADSLIAFVSRDKPKGPNG